MWRSVRSTVALVLLVLAATRSVVAQAGRPISDDCDGDALAARPASSLGVAFEFTPNRVWDRLLPLREGRKFAAMGDTARATFKALASGMNEDARIRMDALLNAVQQYLIRTDTSASFRVESGPSARPMEIRAGDEGEPWRVGVGSAHEIALTDSSDEPTRRAVCWSAMLARRIVDYAGEAARGTALQVLAERDQRWANFESSGYSLTPLELLVNGWCRVCRGKMEPPRAQIVLGHVLPAYLVRNGTGSRAALGFEMLGLLFYAPSRKSYWGVTLVLAYPQEQRREMGVMLHASRLGQVGITAPSWLFSGGQPSLIVSTDLYRFVQRWQGRLRDERAEVSRDLDRLRGMTAR